MPDQHRLGHQLDAERVAHAGGDLARERDQLGRGAGAALNADLPTSRARARVENCRDLTAADMVRNARTGAVRVDPSTYAVTLDGEPIEAPPVERVAFSDRFLLG